VLIVEFHVSAIYCLRVSHFAFLLHNSSFYIKLFPLYFLFTPEPFTLLLHHTPLRKTPKPKQFWHHYYFKLYIASLNYSHKNNIILVSFQVFIDMFMDSSNFSKVMICSLFKVNKYFEGICSLHLQGQ
jgi:hypothetical protein